MIRSLQDLIVQHRASINATTNKTGAKDLTLNKGDVVTGKVLDFNRSGQAKLLVKGHQLSAQTTVQLAKGQLAKFRVEQTQPHYVFKVFEGSGMQQNALQWMGSAMQASPFQLMHDLFQMLEKNHDSPNRKIMLQMVQLFSQIAIKPGDSITPYFLMAFLQRSGLLWESKMKQWTASQKNMSTERFKKLIQQDLKGLTLETLKNTPSDSIEMRSGLEQMLEQIEQWQLLNHKSLRENGKMYFMLPLLFDHKLHTGELLIDVSDARKGQKDPSSSMLKASLLLKMSEIGPVKVESVLFQRQLQIDFWVSSQEIVSIFQQHDASIQTALGVHGIYLQTIGYHLADLQEFAEMSLIHEVTRSNQHLNTFA